MSLTLGKAFKALGISVDILVMSKEGEFLDEAQNGFNLIDLKCNKTYKLPLILLEYASSNKPDVVISSFWKLNLCACLARTFFPFYKLILWEHSPPTKTPFSPAWIYAISASLIYQLSTKIVAVSDGVGDDIRKCTIGLSNKIITIYNPIVPPAVEVASVKASERTGPSLIVSVGRLEPQKNPGLLIRAFSIVCKNNSNVNLLFVGDGSLRSELEKSCRDLNLEDRIQFLGFSPNPYEVLRNADLFVLSSNYEGLGNVIIEALFCGLPIVSTDCPSGPSELLMNGTYGSLVPVDDEVALAAAIKSELSNKREPSAQIHAAQRFMPNIVANKFLEVLK